MRKAEEFSRVTKIGHRASTPHIVLYFCTDSSMGQAPTFGLIINKSIGGSVQRHRIARQLRHLMRPHIATLPAHTHLVARVLKDSPRLAVEFESAMTKMKNTKVSV